MKNTAAVLGVHSGGGGASHSGRMSAEYTLAQAFRQMQGKSVEGLRCYFAYNSEVLVEILIYA